MPRVRSVSSKCTVKMSEIFASSAGEPTRVTPSSAALAALSDRLQAKQDSSKAWAILSTARPTCPIPKMPIERPRKPTARAKSFFSQRPARKLATPSGMRRSRLPINAKVSSATADAFLPGQLAT